MDNKTIAQKLIEYAEWLDAEEASVYRVRAYRQAAAAVLAAERPLAELVEKGGRGALEDLPGIGSHLAYTIESLIRTGEFRTLRPDDGHIDPERLLTSLPGVGPQLARTLHEELGVSTLEQLEMAAHAGRLSSVGVGPKRQRGLMDALAGRLANTRQPEPVRGEPSVDELLTVDERYRRKSDAHQLPTIAPRRFNPNHEPWLPLYNVERRGWRFRALYSNTALAHRLGRTHDWVVIGFNDGFTSGQRTVVTETRGDLRGRRVVRGRERECRAYYQSQAEASGPAHAGERPERAGLQDAAAGGCYDNRNRRSRRRCSDASDPFSS
jgi:hypothetical protein